MTNRQPDEEFFKARVFRPETPCWNWRAYIGRKGYGVWSRAEKTAYAHRVAYELLVGPIPDGLEVHHRCFNRSCVNPEHLELATRESNMEESAKLRTHCRNGHPYDEENTTHGKRGRRCRVCHRASVRRYQKANPAPKKTPKLEKVCKHGHERTDANTYVTPQGTKRCRVCMVEQRAKRRANLGRLSWDEKRALTETCPHGHPWTPENTYTYPNGSRYCRTCNRAAARRAA